MATSRPDVRTAAMFAVAVVLGSASFVAVRYSGAGRGGRRRVAVVRSWTASASSYIFVLFPLVTMLLAAVLAGEPVSVHMTVGALVVMGGVWIGALSGTAAPPAIPAQSGPVEPVAPPQARGRRVDS